MNLLTRQLDDELARLAELNVRAETLEDHARGGQSDFAQDSITTLAQNVLEKAKRAKAAEAEIRQAKDEMGQMTTEESRLKDQKRECEARLAAVEAQRAKYEDVLAEPIDKLEFEESITIELETDGKRLEERLSSSPVVDTQVDDAGIAQLVASNGERKRALEQRRRVVDASKRSFKRMRSPSVPQRRSMTKREALAIDKKKMQEEIEKRTAALERKQKEIQQMESEIDTLVAEIAKTRAASVREFGNKAKILEGLVKQQAEIDELMHVLQKESEELDADTEKLTVTRAAIAHMKRASDNNERDRAACAKSGSFLEKLRRQIREKKAQIQSREDEFRARQEQVGKLGKSLAAVEAENALEEERVQALERANKALEEVVQKATQESHEERELLDQLVKKIPAQLQKQYAGLSDLLKDTD
jgi:chromosome segregation ATPase